jgi:hypothetical protein
LHSAAPPVPPPADVMVVIPEPDIDESTPLPGTVFDQLGAVTPAPTCNCCTTVSYYYIKLNWIPVVPPPPVVAVDVL